MNDYLLILRYDAHRADAPAMASDELQAVIARYYAWTEELRANGHYVSSAKLVDEPKGGIVRAKPNGPIAVDGVFAEGDEIVGGIFTIRADDVEHALSIAQTCPHVDLGGSIEVREIEFSRA